MHAFSVPADTIHRKSYTATRITNPPKIDGILDDAVWNEVEKTGDFIQSNPTEGVSVSQKTEVRLAYDNTAIYVCAMLYDTSPDSILKQLGNRDETPTADIFRIVFDTYNTQLDAFDFSVTASGVQIDSRFSDYNYDAVWDSEAKILQNGWSVEMRIPFSALRFPSRDEQLWGLQFTRTIKRNNEFDQWAFTPKASANSMIHWGKLLGIKNIKPPVRLSLTPYFSLAVRRSPDYGNESGNTTYSNSFSYGGGADIKYGINESFTLDATLLPDFSQVQSDDIRKNLGAFEIYYGEQRPFFTEGVELFQKGNIFYSRRIGRIPAGYYSVSSSLDSTEVLEKNPNQAKLVNATKVSGRTNSGLGIGILNAVTDNTYAIIRNTELGTERKELTEPFTNYNIVVLDQQMKNSSSFYFVNTNVIRSKTRSSQTAGLLDESAFNDANVNAAGIFLNNKKNTIGYRAEGALSNRLARPAGNAIGTFSSTMGYKYSMGLYKNGGKLRAGYNHSTLDKNYNINDMGITYETNFSENSFYVNYREFNPFWKFLNASLNFFMYQSIYLSDVPKGYLDPVNWRNLFFELNQNSTFKNQMYTYLGFNVTPRERRDNFEARTDGRVFIRPEFFHSWFGFGTNSNKKVSIAIDGWGGRTPVQSGDDARNYWYGTGIWPRVRVNDKLSFQPGFEYNEDNRDRGWVNSDTLGNIIFGQRVVRTITSNLSAKYLFKNNLSLNLRGRHYWSTGEYLRFFNLQEDGYLLSNPGYTGNHNFNFNAFTIDMVFEWQFAPGSFMNIIWKNSIQAENDMVIRDFSKNFTGTLGSPQTNTLSVKVLYYLDYLYLSKLKKNEKFQSLRNNFPPWKA